MTKKKSTAYEFPDYAKTTAYLVEVRAKSEIGRVMLYGEGPEFTHKWMTFCAEEYAEITVLDCFLYDLELYCTSLALPYEIAMCVAWGIKASDQGRVVDVRIRPCELSHSLSVVRKDEAEAINL